MSFLELLLMALIFVLVVMIALVFYVYRGFTPQGRLIIRHGPRDSKKVSLTFDDGPDPLYTPRILDILKASGVKASFFLVAANVKKYPHLALRIAQEGHDLGNHSYNHSNLLVTRNATLEKNLIKANKIIMQVTGLHPNFFRPPRGLYNQKMLEVASKLGMETVLWSLSSLDWRGLKPKKIVELIAKKIQGGDIILFHDSGNLFYQKKINHENTVEALPLVISELKKQGWEIVPLSELLGIESE